MGVKQNDPGEDACSPLLEGDSPAVARCVRVAVARWQRDRVSLLATSVEALDAQWLAEARTGVVGDAELGEDDVVEHHAVIGDDLALLVDNVGAHADDVAADVRSLGGRVALGDRVGGDPDRPVGKGEGRRGRAGQLG